MSRGKFGEGIFPSADGSDLALTRESLRRWLARAGVQAPEIDEIMIAVGEACSNAVEHSGAEMRHGAPFAWVEADCDGAAVKIVVTDRGRWKDPDPGQALSGLRGRGRLLMASLMDEVDIRTGPGGTTVHLNKNIAR